MAGALGDLDSTQSRNSFNDFLESGEPSISPLNVPGVDSELSFSCGSSAASVESKNGCKLFFSPDRSPFSNSEIDLASHSLKEDEWLSWLAVRSAALNAQIDIFELDVYNKLGRNQT